MLNSKKFRISCSVFLAVIMTHLPAQVLAEEVQSKMIATQTFVNEIDRAEVESQVRDLLSKQDVQQALEKQGLSKGEALQRLANLSQSEMKQLAQQMEQAKYGGDILVAILLVVLIIFLAKRI